MLRQVAIIGSLSLAVAFSANAGDSDRINQLEKDIQEIKVRLSRLEALLSNPGNAQQPVTSGEGWKSVVNWRKLTQGMSTSDVRQILGEPHRVDGGTMTQWYYQNGGQMTFVMGKLNSWTEPGR